MENSVFYIFLLLSSYSHLLLFVFVFSVGTILDRIDYNMENAVEHAREGVKQLHKAEEHQKANLAIKCIILLVVLIIIMVGVLVWKHSGK